MGSVKPIDETKKQTKNDEMQWETHRKNWADLTKEKENRDRKNSERKKERKINQTRFFFFFFFFSPLWLQMTANEKKKKNEGRNLIKKKPWNKKKGKQVQ